MKTLHKPRRRPTHWLYLSLLTLMFFTTLVSAQEVPEHLKKAAGDLSKTYTINYDENRKILLNLPEGYLIRRMANVKDDVVLCPWNEFFTIASHTMPASGGKPVKDEAAMDIELDAMQKLFEAQGSKLKERKVQMTPAGPVATVEIWSQVEKKTTVVCQVILPVEGELWMVALAGYESALADQRIIQNLLVEELSK